MPVSQPPHLFRCPLYSALSNGVWIHKFRQLKWASADIVVSGKAVFCLWFRDVSRPPAHFFGIPLRFRRTPIDRSCNICPFAQCSRAYQLYDGAYQGPTSGCGGFGVASRLTAVHSRKTWEDHPVERETWKSASGSNGAGIEMPSTGTYTKLRPQFFKAPTKATACTFTSAHPSTPVLSACLAANILGKGVPRRL